MRCGGAASTTASRDLAVCSGSFEVSPRPLLSGDDVGVTEGELVIAPPASVGRHCLRRWYRMGNCYSYKKTWRRGNKHADKTLFARDAHLRCCLCSRFHWVGIGGRAGSAPIQGRPPRPPQH